MLLHSDKRIKEMTSGDVDSLSYYNVFGNKCDLSPNKLDEFLEEFKGKVLINLDRCWDKFPQVVERVRHHDMCDQIILKSPVKPEYFSVLQAVAPDIMYMPMVKSVSN